MLHVRELRLQNLQEDHRARDDAGLVFPVTAPVSGSAMVLHRRTTMSPWTTIKLEAPTFAEATSRFVRAVFPKVCAYALRLAPKLERGAWELLEVTLGPKRVFHQLALAGALQLTVLGWHAWRKGRTSRRGFSAQKMIGALTRAKTRGEWVAAARALDDADGSSAWRELGGGCEKLLDARRISFAAKRLTGLLRQAKDGRSGVHGAMYALRGGALLPRDAFGLLEPRLYETARTGGPEVVERYITAATTALEYVATARDPSVPVDARLAFFNECRHAHGRTALLLSGGAAMGVYHLGVVDVLRTAGLLPRVVSGASAGSIVASLVCCRSDAELQDVFAAIETQRARNLSPDQVDGLEARARPCAVYFGEDAEATGLKRRASRDALSLLGSKVDTVYRLDFFRWRSAASLKEMYLEGNGRSFHEKSILNGDHLADVIRADVGGDLTFQEAFDKTGRILNIPVRAIDGSLATGSLVTARAESRLLNYLKTPHVIVWSASRASCSVPGVYAPSPLLERAPDGSIRYEGTAGVDDEGFEPALYVDGSMGADLPIDAMKAMFNCNHFICSQTNGHAAVLGDSALRLAGAEAPGVREASTHLGGETARSTATLSLVSSCEHLALAALAFVKTQLKAWVLNAAVLAETLHISSLAVASGVEFVPWQMGGWALNLLTQPYEGRPRDVTIVPWAGHLSLAQVCINCLKNPTGAQSGRDVGDGGQGGVCLEEVIDSGKRNTWRELAKIRDHTAVEIALETGVQRLRRRLAARDAGDPHGANHIAQDAARERSPERHHGKAGIGRTPSFYTSPSLLQLSGLNVVDPVVSSDRRRGQPNDAGESSSDHTLEANSGSSEDDKHQPTGAVLKIRRRAKSAEAVYASPAPVPRTTPGEADDPDAPDEPIIKSSHMANFYYRDTPAPRRCSSEDASLYF